MRPHELAASPVEFLATLAVSRITLSMHQTVLDSCMPTVRAQNGQHGLCRSYSVKGVSASDVRNTPVSVTNPGR
jgi:hypothetical protein